MSKADRSRVKEAMRQLRKCDDVMYHTVVPMLQNMLDITANEEANDFPHQADAEASEGD